MQTPQIIRAFASILWPLKCVACAKRIEEVPSADAEELFCASCAATLERIQSPFCTCCGLPFASPSPAHRCALCLSDPPDFDHARALFFYGGAIQDAIWRLKFKNAPHLAKYLAPFVTIAARSLKEPDIIIPVPLGVRRLRTRGYNQAALIARQLSKSLKKSFTPGVLKRIRDTRSQYGLTRAERMTNLIGSFVVNDIKTIQGRSILVVDDVITTTATARAAATALKNAGAQNVDVVAIARAADLTLPHSPGQD